MRASKNIIGILFAMFMVSCSYSSLRPEVVDRSDAQRMQTVIFATVVSIDRVILSGDGDRYQKNVLTSLEHLLKLYKF